MTNIRYDQATSSHLAIRLLASSPHCRCLGLGVRKIIPESHFQEPESPKPQVPANPHCQESADWDFTVYWRTGQWLDVTRGEHLAKQHSCSAEKASSLCHRLQRLAGDVLNMAVYWIQIIGWTGVVKVFEFCIDRDKRAHNLKRNVLMNALNWWHRGCVGAIETAPDNFNQRSWQHKLTKTSYYWMYSSAIDISLHSVFSKSQDCLNYWKLFKDPI